MMAKFFRKWFFNIAFIIFTCEIFCCDGLFDWILGATKETPRIEQGQSTADSPSLLAKIPFELQTVDEKFLSEAVKLTDMSGSDLDQCHHKVILGLKKSCTLLSEEEISKLSVNLLNCQSAVEGRPLYPCTSDMTLQQCTKDMSQETWNAYHIVSNRARAICYGSRQIQFRAKTEMAVNKLVMTAEQQLLAMNVLQEGQLKLGKVTEDTMESISIGHRNLLLQQEMLKSAQNNIQGYVASNLRQLTREKALIAAGQKELAYMTEEIKQKLEKAQQQLTSQETDRKLNHDEILQDLAELQQKSRVVWEKIENSTQKILDQHVISAQHYQAALDNLNRVNHSITYLLGLVERMRHEIDSKLDWLTSVAGGAGNQLTMMITALLHLGYFLLGAIAMSFIGAPTIARVALLLVVPFNALNEIRSGISLDFLALTTVIALSVVLHWIVLKIGRTTNRRCELKNSFSMLTNELSRRVHTRNIAYEPTDSAKPAKSAHEKPVTDEFSDESDEEDITPKRNSVQPVSQINAVFSSVRKTFINLTKSKQKEETGISDTSSESDNRATDASISDISRTAIPKLDSAANVKRHLLDAINDIPQEFTRRSSSRSSTPLRSATPKPICQGFNKTGLHCRRNALSGKDFCNLHAQQDYS